MSTMEERSGRTPLLPLLRSIAAASLTWPRKTICNPRLWVALVILAVPCLVLVAPLFERLEAMGPTGAFLADMFLSAAIVSYILLIIALKKRSAA